MSPQVFTGEVPFPGDSTPKTIIAVIMGRRPPRPAHPTFTENLWTLMQRCWNHDPRLRPEASEVLQVLTSSVPHSFWGSSFGLTVFSRSDLPTWKRLTNNPLPTHECISLITYIFSDRNDVEVVGRLSGDYARAFVDVIDEASTHTLTSEERIG